MAATLAAPFSRIVRGGLLGDGADRGHALGGQRLDLEPDAEAVLRRPDGGHLRSGVARNHDPRFHLSDVAPYRAAGTGGWQPGRVLTSPRADLMLTPALTADLAALLQVILIDVVLAGDNAVVVGLAVAGLPAHQKRRAIIAGIVGATVIRIGFGAITLQLLEIIGLMLAGGLLLLWVCWKMYRELRRGRHAEARGRSPAPRRCGRRCCRSSSPTSR